MKQVAGGLIRNELLSRVETEAGVESIVISAPTLSILSFTPSFKTASTRQLGIL